MDEKQAFVQAVEVWVPDGNLLQRKSGAYGKLSTFAEASAELTLHKGQGLPGAAYRSMQPEVWHELGPRFVRAQSARLSGLDAAVALPWFQGNNLIAVVVFLCGSRASTGGCIELWEPSEQRLLVHMDGYYGKLTPFEDVSRVMRFPLGQGLPGTVWARGLPCIVDKLGDSSSFMRAAAARECGVQSGLGIPLFCGGMVSHVLTLLSAEESPLARAFEIWLQGPDGKLRLEQAHYAEGLSALREQAQATLFAPDHDIAGAVLSASLPVAVSVSERQQAFARAALARELGLTFAVGLPVHDGERMRAVVVLFC